MTEFIYQRFDYDSSKIKYRDYLKRLLKQGWLEIDDSAEYEQNWDLHLDRLNTHRDKNISSFILKRPKPNTTTSELGEILADHHFEGNVASSGCDSLYYGGEEPCNCWVKTAVTAIEEKYILKSKVIEAIDREFKTDAFRHQLKQTLNLVEEK